jgi:hypothetical protein
MSLKLVVLYPPPKDLEASERVYKHEHVPMAVDKLAGKSNGASPGAALGVSLSRSHEFVDWFRQSWHEEVWRHRPLVTAAEFLAGFR